MFPRALGAAVAVEAKSKGLELAPTLPFARRRLAPPPLPRCAGPRGRGSRLHGDGAANSGSGRKLRVLGFWDTMLLLPRAV